MKVSLTSLAVVACLLAGTAAPVEGAGGSAAPSPRRSVDLDVLFVGAHPDDEAFVLSTFGQWHADHGLRTGVVTISRGEGGGNAVGTEEGPELGRLREAEERRAVGKVGITEVFNLDKGDFYYTASAPLTERAWGHEDTLSRLVRVIRQTRPELIVTMDPAPTPGNHGHHQYAGRLAVEAYRAAARRQAFPGQITREGLRPWASARLFINGMRGQEGNAGPSCTRTFQPAEPTDRVYGSWDGRVTADGTTSWAQVEAAAQREYRTQGWGGRPDVPADPNEIGCDYFTQVASRVPYRADARGVDAMLEGALLPVAGGLPLGTGLTADAERFRLTAGESARIRVKVTAPPRQPLRRATVSVDAPRRWRVAGDGDIGTVGPGETATAAVVVTVPPGTTPERLRLPIRLAAAEGRGSTEALIQVTPAVHGEPTPPPHVAEYRHWAESSGTAELADAASSALPLPAGGGRDLHVTVRNSGARTQSGMLEIMLPAGFAADTDRRPFSALAPGTTTTVRFPVRNTDPALPTGLRGGDYAYTITTSTADGAASTAGAALELVPAATVPPARAEPSVDGVASPDEYPGPVLDISERWEGEACDAIRDCSAEARLSWWDDSLYVLVKVSDDRPGRRLGPDDCKRHWRTDAVEITVDPRGRAEDTSSTLKLGVLPATDDPPAANPPCFLRDADNHQGGPDTAPGVKVASRLAEPYTGYTVEVTIPAAVLPAAVDPDTVGLNLLVYDSDTEDKTGQTRLGWSTWPGVQGSPHRWGRARLHGYTPPPRNPDERREPILPLQALPSADSPEAIDQAVRTSTTLGGAPSADPDDSVWVVGARRDGRFVAARLAATGPGTAHVFAVDATTGVLGRRIVQVSRPGDREVALRIGDGAPDAVLVGFTDPRGATLASRAPVRDGRR